LIGEKMTQRAQTQCDQCGQIDDHPKVHGSSLVPVLSDDGSPVMEPTPLPGGGWGELRQKMRATSKHHDCLSHSEEQLLRNSAQTKGAGPKASAIIDACKGGVRGDKLLALIQSGKLPVSEGLHEQAQIAAEKEMAK
jgi:hypothetical protein